MGIEVLGVTKRFGSVIAVDALSLRAEPGELLAIVGPSGCGKTTLLRVIAGLEQADGGRVFIGGRDATPLPPDKRNVGFVFQQFALFPNMNVAENVGYGLRRRKVERSVRERRVAELLAMISMGQYGGRRPHELSAGQQQRVALARALAPEPRTLLLDEPLSALDAAIRHQLRDELRRVQRRVGITTIMVTHDQDEALAIADRVAVMNEGRLEQIDTPWAVYDGPETEFVARFIGRGNFLTGTWDEGQIRLPGLGVWPGAAVHRPSSRGGGGRPVTVLIRPELIGVGLSSDATDGTAPEGTFRAEAVVEQIVFEGERSHVRVRLGASGSGAPPIELVAAVPSGDVPRLSDKKGRPVHVVIPHAALRVLP